jgi:glycosyltransferase involved in cell wall biosynthesis
VKVSILSPIGHNHSPYYWLSMLAFQEYCQAKNIELEYLHNRMSNIYFAREELIAKATGDYILWIDSDAQFSSGHFERLLSHDKDIVCCIAKYYDYKVKSLKWNFGWYMPHAYDSLGIWLRNPLCDEDIGKELIEVDYTGCHFSLIKKKVIESIPFPKFEPLPCSLIYPKIKGYMSEDGAFYYKARLAGYKVYVDPLVYVGHDKGSII